MKPRIKVISEEVFVYEYSHQIRKQKAQSIINNPAGPQHVGREANVFVTRRAIEADHVLENCIIAMSEAAKQAAISRLAWWIIDEVGCSGIFQSILRHSRAGLTPLTPGRVRDGPYAR